MDFIKTDFHSGLFTVTIDSPPLNILNIALMRELHTALIEAGKADAVKVVVIRAEGKAFSAGADVGEHLPEQVEGMIKAFHRIFSLMDNIRAPIVCQAQGACLGAGFEIALYSDIILASEKAKFGQPEILLGAIPPVATAILPYMVGLKKAMEIVLAGEIITADQALSLGLVNHVYPVDNFEEECSKFIGKLTALSAPVLAVAKESLLVSNRIDLSSNVKEAERLYLGKLAKLEDAKEGLQAFMEKRKPSWRNR